MQLRGALDGRRPRLQSAQHYLRRRLRSAARQLQRSVVRDRPGQHLLTLTKRHRHPSTKFNAGRTPPFVEVLTLGSTFERAALESAAMGAQIAKQEQARAADHDVNPAGTYNRAGFRWGYFLLLNAIAAVIAAALFFA